MYVRINTIYGEKGRTDAAIDYIEGSDRAVVEAAAGNSGLATFVDRDAGLIVAASYWDEPLHSSEAALTKVREGAAAVAGGDLATETYEVAAAVQPAATHPGAPVRVARVQIELARIADAIGFVNDEVLPGLTSHSGLCSAQLLIDRSSGAGLVVTAWRDDAAAEAARAVLDQLRDRAADQAGAKFLRVETYTMIRTSARLGAVQLG
ncbi:hypothetical protein ACVGVM_27990 (plasmid) [Pseudonocardia bannensis]|uniref:ABM domain-containing protein n=1 Tax=Pseudonocardia bannensis TaxID=630973 RepID=A0A848DIV5_9PSEU|nr:MULTISPECIES: hypothetical protein [Pseudonocardia]NMH92384.1 hypothetical protein [Pseudonocardia bannensis]